MISTKTIYSSLVSKGEREVERKKEEKERRGKEKRKKNGKTGKKNTSFFFLFAKRRETLRSQQIM